MNLGRVVNHLIYELGLYQTPLPFKDSTTGQPMAVENVVMNVLQTMTIPVYSQFVPWNKECIADLRSLKVVDDKLGIYILPAYLTITPVLWVNNVSLPPSVGRGTFSDIDLGIYMGMSKSIQGIAAGQAQLMLADQIRQEPTFEYVGQNKIKLYGWPRTELVFSVAAQHEPNGESIPDGCYDSFLELATLDMKIFLLNQLKLYDQVQTAFGTINLKTEDYQAAIGERKELLDNWRNTYYVDQPYAITWM